MKTTCRYCGRIHERSYDCGRKPKPKTPTGADTPEERRFRKTEAWKRMSLRIRRRDNYLCQICLRGMYQYDTESPLTYTGIEVHHIVPLAADPERRLDVYNLITLCRYHHELAESGRIQTGELEAIAGEQEEKWQEERPRP